jgi:hypothetical protein
LDWQKKRYDWHLIQRKGRENFFEQRKSFAENRDCLKNYFVRFEDRDYHAKNQLLYSVEYKKELWHHLLFFTDCLDSHPTS